MCCQNRANIRYETDLISKIAFVMIRQLTPLARLGATIFRAYKVRQYVFPA
jgi:hypothetical protein